MSKNIQPSFNARLTYAAIILIISTISYHFSEIISNNLLLSGAIGLILLTASIKKTRGFATMLLFPVVAFGLLNFSYEGETVSYGMLMLGAGSLFSLYGDKYLPIKRLYITEERKSIGGLAGYFLAILGITCYYVFKHDAMSGEYFYLIALISSFVITAVYLLFSRGTADFLIPILFTFLAIILFVDYSVEQSVAMLWGFLFAIVISVISYRVKFLTLSGAIAQFLLAIFIFGFGGWKWTVPILTFFILSSLLSKVRTKKNVVVEAYFEKSGVRDYMQVFANGGLGGILVLGNMLYPSDLFYLIYISTLAAVCADTWGTEIGTLRKTQTYNILNFKPIDQGVSGGISVQGTLGAMLGAFVISFSGIYWVNISIGGYLLLITLSGLFGSIVDSILGATIQAQYLCRTCKKITEKLFHCGEKTDHVKGIEWMNNDVVNLFAGVFGGVFTFLIVIIFL